jgi:hypothetical protein
MATQLQIRRGTSAQVAAFTGAEGEIVVNTTNDSVHVNDGSTAGGFELARADLNNVSDTSLNAALTGNTVSALTVTTLTAGTVTATDLTLSDSTNPTLTITDTTNTTTLSFVSGNLSTTIGTTTNHPLTFDTNNTEAMRITSAGLVGIGTDSPTGNLEIATSASDTGVDLVLDGNKTSNGGIGSIIFNNNGDSVGMIRSNRASANDAADMLFYTQATGGANTQRMAITKDGNVLVGTTTPHLTSSTFAGYTQFAGGHSIQKRSGGIVAYYDRLADDGTIMQFRRQGATVGNISTIGGDFVVGSTSGSDAAFRMDGTNNQIYPANATGSARDDAINLGASTVRWKELYLSGNVNITNPSEDERGLSITDQQDGGQNLKFLYNASSNVGRVINDNVDELRFNGAQGAMINTPSFSAISASDQTTVTNSVATKINFATQLSDTAGGHYATSTSRFTAPHDGTYFFSANISYKGGDGVDDTMYISYYINGADSLNRKFVDNWRASSGTGIERVGTYTLLLPLSAGDYVELFYSGTAYAITMIGRYTKFSGFAVSLT